MPTPLARTPEERRSPTRPVRTVHEDIRDDRTASMVRSLENLIAITTREIADIDAGVGPAIFRTAATRARLVLELQDYHCRLGVLRPVTHQHAAE
jgi:hypothetical protein